MALHEWHKKLEGLVRTRQWNRPRNRDELQQHVASTYSNLRVALAVIGILLAVGVPLIGYLWYGIGLQGSLSAYYFAKPDGNGWRDLLREFLAVKLAGIDFPLVKDLLLTLEKVEGDAPMRSWFVGILFVLGIFFYVYKGFSKLENYLLNAAGIFAVGVALFPTCVGNCEKVTFHGVFAVGGMVFIGLVALLCSGETLRRLPPNERENLYRGWYFIIGVSMVIYPFIVWGVTTLWGIEEVTYLLEVVGMVIFSLYWSIKSKELSQNKAEEKAIQKDIKEENILVIEKIRTEVETPA